MDGGNAVNQCGKVRCIANVSGKCSVAQCKGVITSTGKRNPKDADTAAKFYEIARKSFEHYFGDTYKDEDTEE